MNGLLISVSGVRGIVGKSLTVDVVLKYGRAFGTYLRGGTVILGRDSRRSGPMISSAFVSGLLSTGCNVIDIGLCPTPTVELAVKDGRFDGGAAITASHNPDEYNALKLMGKNGMFLTEKQGGKVNDIFESRVEIKDKDWNKTGLLSFEDKWIDYHINKILKLDIISARSISNRGLKIVADCVGGSAAAMAERFFSRLGVDFKLIHSKPVHRFPRSPEPLPGNLGDLSKAVKSHKADIGFAFDPDADRLAIVSEKGIPIGEEYTLALGARYVLSRKRGSMAVNLSSSLLNDFVAREAKVRLYRSKVGERNVTEKLIRTGGVVGGEGNGGLIYPELHWGRDAFLAAAVVTQYMAARKRKISELVQELPRYSMIKTKVRLSRGILEKKTNAIEKMFNGFKVDKTDGIKLSGGKSWVQIRASNTEPVARIMAEAEDEKTARDLIKSMRSVFEKSTGGR